MATFGGCDALQVTDDWQFDMLYLVDFPIGKCRLYQVDEGHVT